MCVKNILYTQVHIQLNIVYGLVVYRILKRTLQSHINEALVCISLDLPSLETKPRVETFPSSRSRVVVETGRPRGEGDRGS